MQAAVASTAELGRVRARIGAALSEFGREPDHVRAVELVANELLATSLDAGCEGVEVFVEPFRLLTSVRVRCATDPTIGGEPFRLRERVLQGLTIGFGSRQNGDGTTDLWAEIPAPSV